MESASVTADAKASPEARTGGKGLRKDAIGFLDGLSIGLNSTAPAYSLAAVIGSIVVATGVQAPAVLLTAFVPMFFIAGAFLYMNRADQDCGTTFSWVTRSMRPWVGWIGGWAIFTTGVLVIGSLADISVFYIFDLFELRELRSTRTAVVILARVIIAAMTAMVVIGTRVSARLRSAKNLLFIGAAPLIGAAMLGYLLFESARDLADPATSYTGTEVLGVGVPLAIAIVFTGLGLVLMVLWRFLGGEPARRFFGRRGFEAVPEDVVAGRATVQPVGVSEDQADAGKVPAA